MNTEDSLLVWLNLAMSLFNQNLHSGFQPEPELKVTINHKITCDLSQPCRYRSCVKASEGEGSPLSCIIMGVNHSWAV